MSSLEFGVGYINGGPHKPIHSSYAAQKVITGLSQVNQMIASDDPEKRAFASYWLDAISFKLQKEANIKRRMGNWTLEDAQEHNMLIEEVHKAKEAEIRANLARPMSEEEMPDFVLREYQKMYPRDKDIQILLASTSQKKGASKSQDEIDEWFGVHEFILNL